VDPRVLHLSDLELVEVRMMEGEPLVAGPLYKSNPAS
jgi:hypothetical protein